MFQVDQLQICLQKLKENQIIAIPFNGIFYLAAIPSQASLSALNKITVQANLNSAQYLFANLIDAKDYLEQIPTYARFLLNTLLPGPIGITLKANEKSLTNTLTVFLSNYNKLNSLLKLLQTPLLIVPASIYNQPPAVNLIMLESYFKQQVFPFFVQEGELTGLAPTVLDATEINKLQIVQPGPVDYSEIRSILPRSIQLEETWYKVDKNAENTLENRQFSNEANSYLENIIQSVKETKINETEIALILGTKENLRSQFNLGLLSFFDFKNFNNSILINLGSQTNLEGVARNFYSHLFHTNRFGIQKRLLLNQSWPNNKWGNIIKYAVNKYTKEE